MRKMKILAKGKQAKLQSALIEAKKRSKLVSWCFEPSQPQRITSGMRKTSGYLLVIH